MWLMASYQPAALFTLKFGMATATGAKSLLIPTPFAIRTALLDIAIRVEGVAYGAEAFNLLRQLDLALRPPAHAVTTNLFANILKPPHSNKKSDDAMVGTIAFREYVHLQGHLMLAFGGKASTLARIEAWLPHLTYLGRRGGFMQFLPPLERIASEQLPDSYTSLSQPLGAPAPFPLGILQILDDWGPSLTYEKINVFSSKSINRPGAGDDRTRYAIVLPYQFRQAGRGFTLYERMEK